MSGASRRALVLAFASLAALVTPARSARASAPWPDPNLEALTQQASVFQVSAPLAILREEVRIDCVDRGGEPICAVEDRATVVNPTGAAVAGRVRALAGAAGYEDARVVSPAPTPGAGPSGDAPLSLPPGGVFDVVGRATVRPLRLPEDARPALELRHFLYAETQERSYAFRVALDAVFDPSTSSPLHDGHPALVTLRYPSRWDREPGRVSWSPRPDPDPGRAEVIWRGPSTEAPDFRFAIRLHRLAFGGPFVGLGSSLTASPRMKMRVGLDVARWSWLIGSISADTDFRRAVVAPALEAALPGYWYISWAAGVGLPIRVHDTFDAGLRLQLAVHVPFVAAVATVDLFPGLLHGVPRTALYGVYGQVSF